MEKEEFCEKVVKEFEFLVQKHGFRIKSKKGDNHTFEVRYQNQTTAVRVLFEVKDQMIFTDLCRLVNGKLKDEPIIICHHSELNTFDLQDVLILREPILQFKIEKLYNAHKKNFNKMVQLLSQGLKKNAQDILRGDFSIFPELEKLVKSRIKRRKNVSAKEKKLIALLNKE
jgi:hypothetical protein